MPLPGGGGGDAGRCLPARRKRCPPSQKGQGQSAAGRARPVADMVFPDVLSGGTLESGGLFQRLHVGESQCSGTFYASDAD